MIRIATFNLYQFAPPPIYWYEREPRNTYTPADWAEKTAWIADRLAAMDADVVGFQEVFDVAALRTLCADAGYPHLVVVDEPARDADDPQIFVGPVVALASRLPVLAAAAAPVAEAVRADLPIAPDFRFSRTPIRAVVDAPGLGHLIVYVAHLKSKRPIVTPPVFQDGAPWETRVRETMRATSRGHAAALLQRATEASALYHAMTAEVEADPTAPVALLGDLNDDPRSIALEAATLRGRIYEIDRREFDDWPRGTLGLLHDHRFRDAWNLAPQPEGERAPTHVFRGEPGVLDYVLVSNALNERNPDHRARVAACDVLNDHLPRDGARGRPPSDHGLVVATLAPRADVAPFIAPGVGAAPVAPVAPPPPPPPAPRAGGLAAFLDAAGGVHEATESYRFWSGSDKYDNFWAFFFDNDYGWVKSAYGAIPVSTLHQKRRYSIEHIVPQSFLRRYLAAKGASSGVRRGATVNPFNFLAAERDLNSKRSSFPFDFEDDAVRRPYRIPLNPDAYRSTGLDHENEWIVPSRSRGDIARAILYMVLTYGVDELYNDHVDQLRHWAKVDPPALWELAYNDWVHGRIGKRNPFIAQPAAALRWLDDAALMDAARMAD